MGKKKNTAPEYYETQYDTGGLFGSATNNRGGTTFKPTEQMSNAGNTAWTGLNTSLQGLISNDYANDPNFQAYQNQLNKTMTQNYDTSVLSQLANRNLMRSSGLQAATNAFADTLANQTTDLYDSYYNRLSNNLSNYQNTLNSLYGYITGINSAAANQGKALNDYNYNKILYNNANAGNGALAGGLSGAMNGAMAGAMTGNPYAALGGAIIGGATGAMNG
jgi:hypothetical protein